MRVGVSTLTNTSMCTAFNVQLRNTAADLAFTSHRAPIDIHGEERSLHTTYNGQRHHDKGRKGDDLLPTVATNIVA